MFDITPALRTDLPAIGELFRAYAATLPNDICTQGFERRDRVASGPVRLAPPARSSLRATADEPSPSLGRKRAG